MNATRAKQHEEAALATAEYYRLVGLHAKKKSEANAVRVAWQRKVVIELMRRALHGSAEMGRTSQHESARLSASMQEMQ